MGLRSDILSLFGLRQQRYQDVRRDHTSQGNAQRAAAQTAFQNAAPQPPPNSHIPRYPGGSPGRSSDGHISSRRTRPSRDSYRPSRRSWRPRTNDQVQQFQDVEQYPGMSDRIARKPLPLKPRNESMLANTRYRQEPARDDWLMGNNPNEESSGSTYLSQGTDFGMTSRREPGTDSQQAENRPPGEDSDELTAVMGKISHHIRQVKIEFPSELIDEDIPYPYLLEDMERAVLSLITAYKTVCQTASGFEKTLKLKEAQFESSKTDYINDLAQKDKEHRGRISTLKRENDRGIDRLNTVIETLREEYESREVRHEESIKRIQEEHQSEKYTLANGDKLKIQQLEGKIKELQEQHGNQVAQMQRDFDNLKFDSQKSLKASTESWEKQLREVGAKHDDEKRQMQTSFHSQKDALVDGQKQKIQKLESKIRELEKQHGERSAEMQRDLSKLKLDSQKLLTARTESWEKQIREMGTKHDIEKRKMQGDFSIEKAQINNDFLNEKATLSSTIMSQNEIYETQLTQLRRQHRNDKQEAEAEYRKEIEAIEMSRKDIERQYTMLLSIAQENHNRERDQLKKEHESEKAAIRAEQEAKLVQEYQRLREDNEVLKSALVKRDHFKAMSDNVLAERFQVLAREVEDFARFKWENRLDSTWPFPDTLIRKSENTRETKKHVIQNNLWVILYERIFCTPFRVLGEEGRLLEVEWTKNYGQDGESPGALAGCPRPTKDSEKWRYERMTKYLEATSQPIQIGEPYYNMKQGYELSVKDTTEDMSQELEKVAFVSGSDKKRLSDMVGRAASLWLEVGQQRCRIFLLMSCTRREPSRSRYTGLDRDGTQELVVEPELRRMGNAQGERLEMDVLVLNCRGNFSSIRC